MKPLHCGQGTARKNADAAVAVIECAVFVENAVAVGHAAQEAIVAAMAGALDGQAETTAKHSHAAHPIVVMIAQPVAALDHAYAVACFTDITVAKAAVIKIIVD
jgi:hypothetical protein